MEKLDTFLTLYTFVSILNGTPVIIVDLFKNISREMDYIDYGSLEHGQFFFNFSVGF